MREETSGSPLVTVVRDRYVPAGEAAWAITAPLGEALARTFAGDAHFQACTSSLNVRLSGGHVGRVAITLGALVLDVDCVAAHGTDEPAPEAWRAELDAKIAKLAQAHPGLFAYHTRGGARILWALAEPFEITSAADAAWWRRRYLGACGVLEGFGITADRSCADWQRLFRLPHATRNAQRGPEEWPTIGEPAMLGTFELPADPGPGESIAPRPLCAPSGADGAPSERIGPVVEERAPGLLHRLLTARGHVVRAHDLGPGEPAAWLVRCPRVAHHTTPHDAALLIAAKGGGPGWIRCWHAHCEGRTPTQWLWEFDREEFEAQGVQIRDVVITGTACNVYSATHVRICVMGACNDGGPPPPYLRISAGTRAWSALWEAADVAPPEDLDPKGDLGGALAELRGRWIMLEIDDTRRALSSVRRILGAA